VCESSGLAHFFGVMADSQCVGAEKPEPAIFRAALSALDAAPATAVMVGDSLRRDGEGARRTGMRFIWIAPEGTQAAERGGAAEGSVLAAVTELPDLLGILA
jgi:FMN phosphatase YigB (HAD superfamily)